ncbi:MAG: glycosyltransferase [Actinomycetia bacterium]|nr:glycosyltransferase [Actinomycetes bacterium]
MKVKIANYLKQIILKRKKNFIEVLLLKIVFTLYPMKLKKFKKSLMELLSKTRINIISPSDTTIDFYTSIQGGDYWVKYELAKAFGKMGYAITDFSPDVSIHLFGIPSEIPKSSYNIIWIYSHPDLIDKKILEKYDKLFCLSSSFINKINRMGFESNLLIGATGKKPIKRKIKYDVIFIGNTKSIQGGRKIVRDLGEICYNFKVWGRGWKDILPPKYYGGQYFDNQKLNELYASSLITLNDHHEDMRKEGFVSVRIFDILASGGFCISDKNSGIEEIFEGAVPQYESPKHLRELIKYYLNNPEKRSKLMEKGRKIALKNTWKKITDQFLEEIENIK